MASRRAVLRLSATLLAGLCAWPALAQSSYPYAANRREQWRFISTYAQGAFELVREERQLSGAALRKRRAERVSRFFRAAQWVALYIDTHFPRETDRRTPVHVFAKFAGALFFENARQWDTADDWYAVTVKYADYLSRRGIAVPPYNGSAIPQSAATRRARVRELIARSSQRKITVAQTTTTINAQWHGSSKYSHAYFEDLPGESEPGSDIDDLLDLDEALLSVPEEIPW